MELAGFLLLLLFTGGNAAVDYLEDDYYPGFNQSWEEMSGENASSLEGHYPPQEPELVRMMAFEHFGKMNNILREVLPLDISPRRRRPIDRSNLTCHYQNVLDYLKLEKTNDLFTMSRPVLNHTTVTQVWLVMAISAILDVRETDQTFIAYIWIHMIWNNEFIFWNPDEFCDIKHVLVPTEVLWKPDVVIEEMIEKDKAPPSDFLKIHSNGNVEYRNDRVVLSICKMRVYKFPFDVQTCNITFKSFMHSDEEIYFIYQNDTEKITHLSRLVMQTQFEWLFLKMTVSSSTTNISIDLSQTSIVHTIYMKRRSVLYIANFLMPILFFLILDLSSFLIADDGGEKLSFKVTILLAVTVMQLILNEILPCSSDRIPLIAVFCIGIFSLMMLSLLETILVMHLMGKDSETPHRGTDRDSVAEEHKQGGGTFGNLFKEICGKCPSIFDGPEDRTSSVAREGSSSQLTEVSLALGKVSDELQQIQKAMAPPSAKAGYWTAVAQTVNKIFIVFYFTAVTTFLVVIFTLWSISEEEN